MSPPSPIALVVCDNIYQESGGKTALVGLFNRISVPSLPFNHSRLCVYAAATELRSDIKLKLEIVHGESDRSVIAVEGRLPKRVSPLTICDAHYELKNVIFRDAGRHYIRWWAGDHLLIQRPFEVELVKPGKKKEKES